MAVLSKVQPAVRYSRAQPGLIHSLLNLLAKILRTSLFKKTKQVYIYTYLYFVIPRVWNRIISYLKARRKHLSSEGADGKPPATIGLRDLFDKISRVLVTGTKWNQLPFFLVSLILGYNCLNCGLKLALGQPRSKNKASLFNLISASLASWAAFQMYSKNLTTSNTDTTILKESNTSDLTILLLVRALDSLVNFLTNKHIRKQKGGILARVFDPLLFTASCAVIMTSWFYYPEKLPRSYHKWITMASTTDEKLIHLLREIHFGRLVFNRIPEHQNDIETLRKLYHKFDISYPEPSLSQSKCESKIEPVLSNPDVSGSDSDASIMPYVNCQLVHRNISDSCEIHALWRLVTGFKYAFMIYLPLNCLLSLKTIIPLIKNHLKRTAGQQSRMTWRRLLTLLKPILISSSRSSVFLSSFIVIIYYTICVSRNYLPLILKRLHMMMKGKEEDNCVCQKCESNELSWRTKFDKYSPIAGSILCGLSIFFESKRKQGELAMFVFMKGLYSILIREEAKKPEKEKDINQRKAYYIFSSKKMESLVFSLSFSTLIVLYQRDKTLVRGVFNNLIGLCV